MWGLQRQPASICRASHPGGADLALLLFLVLAGRTCFCGETATLQQRMQRRP